MSRLNSTSDLGGCIQRITRIMHDLQVEVDQVREQWHDTQAEKFHREHIGRVGPTIDRLVIALQEAMEIRGEFGKKLRDPQDYS